MYKRIHFVGIKGAGMTPLAIMAKEAGIKVTGSDVADIFITDETLKKKGIPVFEGFDRNHVKDADLVVVTGAHGGLDNLEALEAKRKRIRVVTQGEAVGMFMKGDVLGRDFTGISVSGTNGKTTTTAMIATILKSANFDPSYIIGTSFVPSLGCSGHLGKGKYFVAEADEYATDPTFDKTPKFLWQKPKILVITNIDFDHPDIYPSIKEVKEAFKKFVIKVPRDGAVIACGDNPNVQDVLKDFDGNKITYGMKLTKDYVISDVKTENTKTQFRLNGLREISPRQLAGRNDSGLFKLNIFGEQNVYNATAAIAVGKLIGLSLDQLKKGISLYKGSKRRSEFIGRLPTGAFVFDDYAHNPTKIAVTLRAFRAAYPNKKIVCIFQPHTYTRTKILFEQFVTSFNDADAVIITNIYASLREKKDPTVSSKQLADAIRSSRGIANVIFLPQLQDVVEYINKKKYGKDVVIITMGAGDVYKINEKILARRHPRENEDLDSRSSRE